MNHLTMRGLGAVALGLVLAACSSDQVTDAAGSRANLDLSTAAVSPLVINEIMPNPAGVTDELGEWFEIYNTGTAAIDLQNYRIASNNDAVHVINTSVVVPAGGYVVLARNGNTATNGGVTANYSYAHQTFNLNNTATDWLALRDPSGASLDSVSWGTASPPNGASRGLTDATLDNLVMSGANWATQTTVYGLGDKGTPGAANDGATSPPPPPPPGGTGDVVINEILQDPQAVLDANGEWFEVHNRGTTPVNLQGWTIASLNDVAHVITGSVVIPAGGFAVLGRNGNAATNGGVTVNYVYAGTTTLNLGNGTDWLALRDGAGASVDSIAWTSVTAGTARALIDPASDNVNVNGSAWTGCAATFGAGDRGTPGASNAGCSGGGGGGGSVSLSINAPRQIPVGYTKPAFPTARNAAGQVVTDVTYTWSSSNPSVAAVDSLGYINGLGVGTATITATASNGGAGSATIEILPADVPTSAVYRNHLEFGTPDGATGIAVNRREFASSYSETRGGPNWVSWNINATQFGAAPRCDCFTADQTLPSGVYKVVDFNYRNGGYDRGHMVQSESRTATYQENAATFLLTNILPQAGENNQGPWSQFENYLNDLARQQGKEIYVVAGGEYTANPATLKNEGKVQVPAFTWKVAVVVDGGEGLDDVNGTGDLQVIAIRMPNDTATAAGIRNNPWTMYETTVDDIEARTGYDLLDALPNGIERIVESKDRAPVAATDGPYVGIEGSSVTLSAAGSSDPDGDALTYAWSFGDGAEGTGATPTHTYADNGTYQVTVIVTDPYGAADSATTTVTVMNVAPTVAAFAHGALLQGEVYATGGSFADPGADEWTATVDYGDGSGVQPLALAGNGFALSHRYTAAGTFTVTVRVTDDDGAEGVRTASVTVRSPGQAVDGLASDVSGLNLARGAESSLNAKLRAAGASLERGQGHTAVNQLNAFINEVQAMAASGRMTAADAAALTAAAQRIIASIESA
jgi:DNA/RNA endonuclease G (NUC1)